MRRSFNLILSIFLVVPALYADQVSLPDFLSKYPKQSYQKLRSNDQIVGRSKNFWAPFGTRIRFTEISEMKLRLFKKAQAITTNLQVETDQELKFNSFEFSMKTTEADIQIKGQRSGNHIKIEVRQAGNIQFKEVPYQEPLLLGPLVRPYVLMKGLPEKELKLQANLLEPSAMTVVPLTIDVVKLKGKSRWKMTVDYLSQQLVTIMNERAHAVYEKSDLAGMPIEAEPISAKQYKNLKFEASRNDLVEVARVSFPKFDEARTIDKLTIELNGVDLKTFDLSRHRQELDDQKLSVTKEKLPPKSTPVQALVSQKGFDKYLKGDATIPVYHEKIQKIAKELIGKENDLWKRALIIHNYVYRELEKIPTVSVPNALEVLATKRGDCNEHAVLYTALARAAGVPTRTVVGLVYSDLFYGKPGFYYHAWVEVYTGKEWVAIDPTWNQVPADATHLAFVEGGLDQQVLVTSLMGKVKVKPVSPPLGRKPAKKQKATN